MIRPRLALATFLLLAFGVAAGADAAEWGGVLLAQTEKMDRGWGFYLHVLKLIPVILIFFLWVATTSWVNSDTHELENKQYGIWTTSIFAFGLLGLISALTIPFYAVGLTIFLLLWLAPVLVYVGVRNSGAHDEDKVLTPYHLGEVANDILRSMGGKGPFNRPVKSPEEDIPVTFAPRGLADKKVDPELVEQALVSEAILPAKELVFDAVTRRATDIHLEPNGEVLGVRYRIDGLMHAAEPFDRETGEAVVDIFKVISGLDVNERRKPQEGVFGAKIEKRDVDFRLATSGSKTGENVVLRIADTGATVSKLEDTGLRPKLVQRLQELIANNQGLILCAGTPSSGKTSTLYACLRTVDRFQRNVMTLEDLIEHPLDNVQQMTVDVKKGEHYPEKLRSVLRQEPDVIMVGEIRDKDQEVAALLCQAANSGRMAMTSIQANDTVEALFRLLDMGVDPNSLASGLSAVVAQRLVRLLCETCKEPYKPKPDAIRKLNLPADKIDVFYRPPKEPNPETGPCPDCGATGYLGRTGIFEVLEVTDPIRDLIRENPSANAIRAEARKNGMIYLQEDGMRQVIQGRTSIDELRRVVK